MKRVEIATHRTGYSPEQVKNSLTVQELIEILSQYDDDAVVMFNNDNGYTFGAISENDIDFVDEIDEDNDDEYEL